MVIKANVNDLLCPVILEVICNSIFNFSNTSNYQIDLRFTKNSFNLLPFQDCSSNGTFIKSTSSNERTIKERLKSTNGNKQQVLAANDTIFIQLNPTLAFIYRSFNTAYNELPTEINRLYHVGKELGRGAYGMVYYTLHRRTCQAYALKYITINADDQLMKPEREIELLRKLNHPCIVRMHYNYSNSNAIAIFLDFMAGGDLLDRIQQMRYLPESLTKCLFYQICCGVEYLHQQGITHRDLKPDNILLASSERETLIRISDFGLSRLQSHSNMATRCGTEIYLAPEVQTLNYTNKVDIWSLGVILYNCLCGQYPFLANSSNKLVRFQQDIWFDVSDAAKHVIRCALRVNANERPSIREMLANVWFDKNDPSIQKACQIMDKVEEFIVNSF